MPVRYEPEVLPGYTLYRATQDYFDEWKEGQLAFARGTHDPDFVLSVEPMKDPLCGLSDEQLQQMLSDESIRKCCDAYQKVARQIDLDILRAVGGAMTVYQIIQAAASTGYNPTEHGAFGFWLSHHLASFLENNNPIDDYASQREEDSEETHKK